MGLGWICGEIVWCRVWDRLVMECAICIGVWVECQMKEMEISRCGLCGGSGLS